ARGCGKQAAKIARPISSGICGTTALPNALNRSTRPITPVAVAGTASCQLFPAQGASPSNAKSYDNGNKASEYFPDRCCCDLDLCDAPRACSRSRKLRKKLLDASLPATSNRASPIPFSYSRTTANTISSSSL